MEVFTIIGVIISLAAATFAFYQAKIAKDTVKQANLMRLFSTFDVASQVSIEKPELLYSVHGLSREVPESDAIAIAYLSCILDGFQFYYSTELNGDFSKIESKLMEKSNFLSRILAISENQKKWIEMKRIYYGDFDDDFLKAIDKIIANENSKKSQYPNN